MESKIYWIDGRQTGWWSKLNANSKSKVNLVSILQFEFTSCLEITTLKWNEYFIGGQTRMEIHAHTRTARHGTAQHSNCENVFEDLFKWNDNNDLWCERRFLATRAHTLTDTHSISLWRDPFILILFILLCFSLEFFLSPSSAFYFLLIFVTSSGVHFPWW